MNRMTRLLLVVFAVSVSSAADGQTFKVLLSFSGSNGAYPGDAPPSDLTLSGSTLYGMTWDGGANGFGNIFSINTDGSGFQNLLSFTGTSGAYLGDNPRGSLTLSGSTLYGVAALNDIEFLTGTGMIFSISTSGTNLKPLLPFDGTDYASVPGGPLTLGGSTLYGVTIEGGADRMGTICSIATTGGNLQALLSFSGTDGDWPVGSLTLVGSTLYGMTAYGGAYGDGNIFSINTDGSGFQDLFDFNGANGESPGGSLTLDGLTLYGTTAQGGEYGDGVVFSLAIPEPSTVALLAAAALGLLGCAWRRRRRRPSPVNARGGERGTGRRKGDRRAY
jgi:uncharacterized repeat protein (TIGR03803 family)